MAPTPFDREEDNEPSLSGSFGAQGVVPATLVKDFEKLGKAVDDIIKKLGGISGAKIGGLSPGASVHLSAGATWQHLKQIGMGKAAYESWPAPPGTMYTQPAGPGQPPAQQSVAGVGAQPMATWQKLLHYGTPIGLAASFFDRRYTTQADMFGAATAAQSSWGAMLNMQERQLSGMARNNLPYGRSQQDFMQMGQAGVGLGIMGDQRLMNQLSGSVTGLVAGSGGGMTTADALGTMNNLYNPNTARRGRMFFGASIVSGPGQGDFSQYANQIIGNVRMNNGQRLSQMSLPQQRQILQTGMRPGSYLMSQITTNLGVDVNTAQQIVQQGMQNTTFQERGGQGALNLADPAHRRIMGLDAAGSLGLSQAVSDRARAERGEQFMQTQEGAMIKREELETRVTESLTKLDEALKNVYGTLLPVTGVFGKLFGAGNQLLSVFANLRILGALGGGGGLSSILGGGGGAAAGAAGATGVRAAMGTAGSGILGKAVPVIGFTAASKGFVESIPASWNEISSLWGTKSYGAQTQDKNQRSFSTAAVGLLNEMKASGFQWSADWYSDSGDFANLINNLTRGVTDDKEFKKIMQTQIGPAAEAFIASSSVNSSTYNRYFFGVDPDKLWKTKKGDIDAIKKNQGTGDYWPDGPPPGLWGGINTELKTWYDAAQGTSTKEDVEGVPKENYANAAGLNPWLKERLRLMFAANPKLKLVSGFRTYSEQAAMRRERYDANGNLKKGYAPAAKPGSSLHEIGLAADLGPPSEYSWIMKNAAKFGLTHLGDVNGEPWHVQPMGTLKKDENYDPNWKQNFAPVSGVGASSGANPAGTVSGTAAEPKKFGAGGTLLGGGSVLGETSIGAAMQVGLTLLGSMQFSPSDKTAQQAAAASAMGGGATGFTATGGILSADQLTQLFFQTGWRKQDLVKAVAISLRESGGNPNALADDYDDLSYGLFQLNMIGGLGPARRREWGLTSNEQLYDPQLNAKLAFGMYQSQGWNPWTTRKGVEDSSQWNVATTAVNSAGLANVGDAPVSSWSGGAGHGGVGGGSAVIVNMSMPVSVTITGGKASDIEARRIGAMIGQSARREAMVGANRSL